MNDGSSSSVAESESFELPPYLKDKTHKQGKTEGSKFLEVLAGPSVDKNSIDVAMFVSVLFESNPSTLILSKYKKNGVKNLRKVLKSAKMLPYIA